MQDLSLLEQGIINLTVSTYHTLYGSDRARPDRNLTLREYSIRLRRLTIDISEACLGVLGIPDGLALLQEDRHERIFRGVITRLKLEPITDLDPESGEIDVYPPSSDIPFQGERSRVPAQTDSIDPSDQEAFDILIRDLTRILVKRHSLLEKYFNINKSARSQILPSIERCLLEIKTIQASLIRLSENTGLPNRFIPPAPKKQLSLIQDEDDTFQNAIHFERIKRWNKQRELLRSFSPSPSEKYLLGYAPGGFREYEWPLFRFTFYEHDEVTQAEYSSHKHDEDDGEEFSICGYGGDDLRKNSETQFDSIMQEDGKALINRLYERKLLIWYYAYRHSLVTHPLRLPGDFGGIMRTLEGEIALLQRKLKKFNSRSL